MPARRRNPPPTSSTPATTATKISATATTTRSTTATTRSAQAKPGAPVAMASTTTTTTTTTLRRSPRLIVTGHYHQSRALQKQVEPKTKPLKRQCCQSGRTRTGRVLPDPVAMTSSSSSTSEEEEEDARLTSCTTRRKRKENSTTLLVESPAKRLRTRAVVVTAAAAPPGPQAKPKVSSQAPSPPSTPRPPAGGRLTRSSTIASRATTTIHKIIPNNNNVITVSRSPPEPVPPPAPVAPSSPPPQHGPSFVPCKSKAPSPSSSPSTSAFTLLASSPQRAPLDMIDIGPPLISHNEPSRHSGFSGIPGLVSSLTESAEYASIKDSDQCIKEGIPLKAVTGTGIWTSPPSPLTPLSTAPPSPTSPTTGAPDVFDVKLDLLSSSSSSPPPSPVLPSGIPSLASSSLSPSAVHDSMDVDTLHISNDSNLAALEAPSVTQNGQPQLGLGPNQTEVGLNAAPPMTQPQSTLSMIHDMGTYGFSQEHFPLPPQAQPQFASQPQSQSQSQLAQTQPQTQAQAQSPQQQQQQQPVFAHSYTWYDIPDSSTPQQQILHWEEPPRMESTKNVWKFACKYRVWDVLCRYTPTIIRSVVAQEASDYHTMHGYSGAYFPRARYQRMRRRMAVDTSSASGASSATRGVSASSPGPAPSGRKKRRKIEVDEKSAKGKDKEKKGPKSKSRNGTPTPDAMDGVEVLASSVKEGTECLQLPTLQQPSPQPSPTSPESEREKFMDEEYYDWEIRSDGDEEDDDEEAFYYYEDDEDEDDEDDDDECYEETDSEDEDYMDDEMFNVQATGGVEGVEKRAGIGERVSMQISEDGKKKHGTGDAHLGMAMDMDVSKDPSFNAELTTSLSCSSPSPPCMTPGNGDGCPTSESASQQQSQEGVGMPEGAESSSLSTITSPSSSGAIAPSLFLPSMPCHSSKTDVKSSSTRGDTLISMFYCPPPHPPHVNHVNHLNSHVHPSQANLASAPQHQLQTQEPPPQQVPLSQSVQSQQQERLQPLQSQSMGPMKPDQSLQPPQPLKPLQPIPSTQPLHQSPSPTPSPFVSDPSATPSPPIRPSTPVPTSPVFCMNEYGTGSDRYQSNGATAASSPPPLAPISPVSPINPITPISPITPLNPITPISPLSSPMPAPPVLPLPPPRLASIRVRPLRYGDLGLASVIGKGTPVNTERAMQWARAGQCTWSPAASRASTRGKEVCEMRDVVMEDMREENAGTKEMGEMIIQGRCTTNSMTSGSVNNGECEMKDGQGQGQGLHQSLGLQREPSQQQHEQEMQAQGLQQGSQEQDKMPIITAFSETDQSIWDAFFATLQAAEHDVTGEVKPQSVTEATSSPIQTMLSSGDMNTNPGNAPGAVAATPSSTVSSARMSENGNDDGIPPVASGSLASSAPTVNAATTTMFTRMGFGLSGALGFVSGSVNVNSISLGFGSSASGASVVPENIPDSERDSSTSGDQCSTAPSASSPLTTTNVSGGPLSNIMNPLYAAHHPHMGNVVGDMTMNGVQTYLSGSPLSIPLSMSMPMGMSGLGTMSAMGMTVPMSVVSSHEPSSPSSPPPMPMAAGAVAGASSSCPSNSTPGTSALSFALG